MKALIWKELRENFPWALLACFAMLLAEIYSVSAKFDPGSADGFSLCASLFLMATSLGCPLVGAALGALQILPEQRRDQWAALLHRPAPRGVIFLGKAIAGLLLYFFATLIPFAAATGYVAMPHEFPAPFVPGMMIPGLTDLVPGVVAYFAAILLCMGRGKWFGARGMAVLAFVGVLYLHVAAGWSYPILTLIALLLFAVAAWGAMLANGPAGAMPLAARISQAIVVLAGAQTALMLLALSAFHLAQSRNPNDYFFMGEFVILDDGRVIEMRGANPDEPYSDLDGKPIELGPDESPNSFFELPVAGPLFPLMLSGGEHRRNINRYAATIPIAPEAPEYWFLLTRDYYLVGYDKLSHRCIGFLDRQGFKPPGSHLVPFATPVAEPPGPWAWGSTQMLVSGSRVYLVDFSERSMNLVFDGGPSAVQGAALFGDNFNRRNFIAVAVDDQIRILDKSGNQLFSFPLPGQGRDFNWCSIGANKAGDRISVQTSQEDPNFPASRGYESYAANLYVYDAKGTLLHTYSMAGHKPATFEWSRGLPRYCVPPAAAVVSEIYSRFHPGVVYYDPNWLPLFLPFQRPWTVLLVIASILAIAAFFRAWYAGLSLRSAAGWTAFTLLLGPAGFIAFLSLADFPVRIRCPFCGHKRAIRMENCPHCRQPWTMPQRNGSEIYDATV